MKVVLETAMLAGNRLCAPNKPNQGASTTRAAMGIKPEGYGNGHERKWQCQASNQVCRVTKSPMKNTGKRGRGPEGVPEDEDGRATTTRGHVHNPIRPGSSGPFGHAWVKRCNVRTLTANNTPGLRSTSCCHTLVFCVIRRAPKQQPDLGFPTT